MTHWVYTFLFIFSILVVIRTIFDVAKNMFASNPIPYQTTHWELALLGTSLAFILTFLIN